MKNLRFLTAGLFAVTALAMFGWGQKGHDVTCFIAENHLTPTTKAAVEKILGGKSMVYYSNWLDNASHGKQYGYTKTWHYKNIDEGQLFEEAPLLETGDIVRAIPEQIKILKSDSYKEEDKFLAMKILIHLVGDIHQPMHMGHKSDLGGNQWNVKFFNGNSNLHSVWDSSLVEAGHKWTYTEWRDQIDRATPEEEAIILYEGNPENWGKECAAIAAEIYAKTPMDSKISYDYIAEWTPVVETQFLKGGLRLADILNSIYDPHYKGSNLIVSDEK